MTGVNDDLMAQLRESFAQEAAEGLDLTEAKLLEMDRSDVRDEEDINAVFRAIHSIKGGSGTFGYQSLIRFTHAMETLLDAIRGRQRPLDAACIEALLSSVDQVRALLEHELGGRVGPGPTDDALLATLHRLVGAEPPSPAEDVDDAPAQDTPSRWRVSFRPHAELMAVGNDPVNILRELCSLGEATVEVDTEALPAFEALDPERMHLGWTVTLVGGDEPDIREVFEWVEDEADITIEPLAEATEAPVAPPAPTRAAPTPPAPSSKPAAESASIRVSTDKIDGLINLVGELVITQSMLGEVEKDFSMAKLESLREGLAALERNTRELQEGVMRIRMLPIRFVFNRFPRIVRDLGQKLGKQVDLQMTGEGTELDKTVLERIADPMVHLLRNSLDHGLEAPEVRRAAGKPETGTIHLHAFHQGGSIHIRVQDDGAGIDHARVRARAVERGLLDPDAEATEAEVLEMLFEPGFSTAQTISDVSGRGVGLDVVRRNVQALGGHIEVSSAPGEGTTFEIRLPLTLSILDGQLVRVGDETYIIPLVSIVESLQVDPGAVKTVAGASELYRLRDEYLPIVRLYERFRVPPTSERLEDGILVVVEGSGKRACIFVDEPKEQQQVVIKSLETNFRAVRGISGATILGNGRVALILDIPGLIGGPRASAARAALTPSGELV